jgi:hypothetical protein
MDIKNRAYGFEEPIPVEYTDFFDLEWPMDNQTDMDKWISEYGTNVMLCLCQTSHLPSFILVYNILARIRTLFGNNAESYILRFLTTARVALCYPEKSN